MLVVRSPPWAITSARPAPVDIQRLSMLIRSRACLVESNGWRFRSSANSNLPAWLGSRGGHVVEGHVHERRGLVVHLAVVHLAGAGVTAAAGEGGGLVPLDQEH